jgi:hypothetical protein
MDSIKISSNVNNSIIIKLRIILNSKSELPREEKKQRKEQKNLAIYT